MGKTALLIMDVQNAIVSRFADEEALRPIQDALAAARDRQLPVIFVRVAFRPGYPDVSARNRSFARVAEWGNMTESDEATQIWRGVQPLDHEPVVVKRRVSAFAGSGLELLLRSMEIEHLVLCGIATSGVVLSTVREAADKDYRLTVLKDACLDNDPEVHRVLVEKVFPRQADVLTVREWLQHVG
ncbi:MAG: cysteine hydrolase [Firmicutes bacterium]|nr:cysteine hydrolase [Bacillota bacterium]